MTTDQTEKPVLHGHASTNTNARYRPEIDGLRALAVVPVVLFHLGLGCPGGYVGVDVFFIISGFLITRLIHDEILQGTFSFANFWERRVRRIFPAMFVVLITTFIASCAILLPDDFAMFARSAMAQIGLVANIFFRKQSNYFAPAAETMPLLHTWSLSVEEQFYVAFPVILFFAAKWRRNFPAKAIILLLGASFVFSVYVTHQHAARAFFHLQSRAWELALGALLVILPAWNVQRKWLAEIFSWAGIGAIILAIVFYDNETRFPGVAALLPCLGAFFFIWSNTSEKTSAGKIFALKPLVFIGLISYSLYLWHWPLIVFIKYRGLGDWTWEQIPAPWKLGLIAGLVAVAAASWRWIETPFRRRSICETRRPLFTFAGVSCALILIAAGCVRWKEGVPSRFSPEVLRFAEMKNDRSHLQSVKLEQAQKGNFIEVGATNANKNISVLIWGDSHAMAAAPGLASLCKELNLRAIQATHSSTAPICDLKQRSGLREKADEFAESVVAFVRKEKIPNVILAARWKGYDPDEEFKSHLLETVKRLRNVGAEVWILKEVPNYFDDVPRAAAKAVLAGRDPELIGVPLEHHRAERRKIDAMFEGARVAGAQLLDPAEVLVNSNGVCLAVADGKCLYADYHHLTTHGAMRLKPLFGKILGEQR